MADLPVFPNQDRTLDYMTVQTFCVGCPFKGVKSRVRNPLSNGDTNPVEFDAAGMQQAPLMSVTYECTSPLWDIKKLQMQEHTNPGGGWCPFFEQRWALKEGEPYGG